MQRAYKQMQSFVLFCFTSASFDVLFVVYSHFTFLNKTELKNELTLLANVKNSPVFELVLSSRTLQMWTAVDTAHVHKRLANQQSTHNKKSKRYSKQALHKEMDSIHNNVICSITDVIAKMEFKLPNIAKKMSYADYS